MENKEINMDQNLAYLLIQKDITIKNINISKEFPIPLLEKDMKKFLSEKSLYPEDIITGLTIAVIQGPDAIRNAGKKVNIDPDKAYEYFKTLLLRLQPDAVERFTLAGYTKTDKEDFTFAQQLFSAVVNLTHSDIAYINLATMYAKKSVKYSKTNDKAMAELADENLFSTLHKGLEHNPDSLAIKAELGAYHLRHKDLDVSYDYFKEFVDKAPDSEQKNQIQTIVSELQQQLQEDNTIYEAYDQIMLQHFEKALELLDKYQKNSSDQWDGWFLRGWTLRCLQKFEEAKKCLLISLEKDFNKSESYNELSLCCKALNEKELAKEYLNIAMELDEENVIYVANLSFLHLADKEFDKAKYYLEKARSLDENDPQVKALVEEYEGLTGEKLGSIIKEEYVDKTEIENLKKESQEKGTPLKEI